MLFVNERKNVFSPWNLKSAMLRLELKTFLSKALLC